MNIITKINIHLRSIRNRFNFYYEAQRERLQIIQNYETYHKSSLSDSLWIRLGEYCAYYFPFKQGIYIDEYINNNNDKN